MTKPIISGSGIRGIFGESLNVGTAMDFAAAFGELMGPGMVALGRDTRRSGPAVEAAVTAGLMATGCTPVILGVVPTPTIQLESMREGFVGGIAVTASHNPGDWNALKLIGSDGVFLRSAARRKLMRIIEAERKWVGNRGVHQTQSVSDAIERHVEKIARLPGVRREGRRLRAVLDTTGGTATGFTPLLMDALGVEWILINGEMTPDGNFPRIAEPTTESLSELSEAVTREGADIGFGFDPDGDRVALVAENGRLLGEEFTLALALDFVLASRPGPVVINLSTSMLSGDAAARHDCPVYRSPVGEVNVVEEMESRGARIGGEGNGGVIDMECHPGRDAGVGAAYAISFLREREDLVLSSWADSFTEYHRIKQKISLDRPFGSYIPKLVELLGKPDDTRDGLWFARDGGWAHIRASGTEPVVRFIGENLDERAVRQDLDAFRKAVSATCVESSDT